MAVVSVQEMARSGTVNREWKRTYQRTYLVITDSVYDGAVSVIAALPVQLGYPYRVFNGGGAQVEFDGGSFVNSIEARQETKDGLNWEATVGYEPYNPSVFGKNPIDHPIKVSWGGTKYEKAADKDVNGGPVLNSAGDYFDPPATIDDARLTLKIERNEARYDPSIAVQYNNAINSDIFFGQQPGTWKSSLPVADLEFNVDSGTADGFYYKVTYEFEFRAEGWQKEILDQGLRYIASGKRVTMKDDAGDKATSPAPLDGHGAKLAEGSDPVFLTFDVFNEVAFAALNLDPGGAPGQ